MPLPVNDLLGAHFNIVNNTNSMEDTIRAPRYNQQINEYKIILLGRFANTLDRLSRNHQEYIQQNLQAYNLLIGLYNEKAQQLQLPHLIEISPVQHFHHQENHFQNMRPNGGQNPFQPPDPGIRLGDVLGISVSIVTFIGGAYLTVISLGELTVALAAKQAADKAAKLAAKEAAEAAASAAAAKAAQVAAEQAAKAATEQAMKEAAEQAAKLAAEEAAKAAAKEAAKKAAEKAAKKIAEIAFKEVGMPAGGAAVVTIVGAGGVAFFSGGNAVHMGIDQADRQAGFRP